jgi:hypothetical protein
MEQLLSPINACVSKSARRPHKKRGIAAGLGVADAKNLRDNPADFCRGVESAFALAAFGRKVPAMNGAAVRAEGGVIRGIF